MRDAGDDLADFLSNLGSAFKDLCSAARNGSESMKIGSIRAEIESEERYETLRGPRKGSSGSSLPSFRSSSGRSGDGSVVDDLTATVSNLASFCVHASRAMANGLINAADESTVENLTEFVRELRKSHPLESDEALLDRALRDIRTLHEGNGIELTSQMRREILNRLSPGRDQLDEW